MALESCHSIQCTSNTMEKESAPKRSCIFLPCCVRILLTLLLIVSLSMNAVVLWQINVLQHEFLHQEVTIRNLQSSKNNGTSTESKNRRDLESLHRKIDQLTAKPIGTYVISESIHLVGDEKKFPLQAFDQKVKSWVVNHRQGTIDYVEKDGAIVISVPGTYYIYCQMHYYNEKEHLTGHITYINDIKILESIVGISNGSLSKHFTKQHGGLFRVDRNDRIQVRLPFSHNSYKFTRISSYFGVFRVGP